MSGDEHGDSAWMDSLRQNPSGAVHCQAPCTTCGTQTTARAVTGVRVSNPITSEMNLTPELVPCCGRCEERRVMAQLEALIANEAVLPRLREAYRQQLAGMQQVAA